MFFHKQDRLISLVGFFGEHNALTRGDGSRIVGLCQLVESGGRGSPVRDHTESSCINFFVVDRRHYGRFKNESLSDCHTSDLIGHSHIVTKQG